MTELLKLIKISYFEIEIYHGGISISKADVYDLGRYENGIFVFISKVLSSFLYQSII